MDKELRAYENSWFVFLALLSIPFIQLGISYYLSVFFIVFCCALLICFNSILYNSKLLYLILLSVSFVFLFKFISLVFSGSSTRDSFIPIREWLCFCAIFIFSENVKRFNFLNFRLIGRTIFIILLCIFGLVLFQLYFFSKGSFFGFPSEFFVINQGTLLGVDKALYFDSRLRPMAFYGEPSYTGWIVFSLLFVVLSRTEFNFRFKVYVISLSLLIVLLSQSFSGILAISLISIYWYVFTSRNSLVSLGLVCLVAFIFFVALFDFSTEFRERVLSINSNEDVSFNIRIDQPIDLIVEMYNRGDFFGVANFSELQVDNAGFALVLMYGVMSIFILLSLFFYFNNFALFLYVLISLNFNGAFLRFDKVLLLGLVVGLCYNSVFSNRSKYVFS